MNTSPSSTIAQFKEVLRTTRQFSTASMAQHFVKRVVIHSPTLVLATALAERYKALGYHCEVAPALKSDAFYINVHFNNPF
jgi:hypothetical protein